MASNPRVECDHEEGVWRQQRTDPPGVITPTGRTDNTPKRNSVKCYTDITNWGTDLKLKLRGCWMCFRRFPTRLTVRSDLCQEEPGRETSIPTSFFPQRYTVQRWLTSLLISSPHYFRTNSTLVVSKHQNTTSYRSLPECLSNIHPVIRLNPACFLCKHKNIKPQAFYISNSLFFRWTARILQACSIWRLEILKCEWEDECGSTLLNLI